MGRAYWGVPPSSANFFKYSGNNLKQENKLKEYGVGAQILIDLGVKKMNLISDTNATPINLEGYDLEISNRQPLEDKN